MEIIAYSAITTLGCFVGGGLTAKIVLNIIKTIV